MILIAGPCVIDENTTEIAQELSSIFDRWAPFFECYFKASYDKANRTSIDSYRGPGLKSGLSVLKKIKRKTGMKLTTDVHLPQDVSLVAEVVDLIQIPALLCRQTDLLVAAGHSGRHVNLKKGPYMAPEEMFHAVQKVESACQNPMEILITERGTCLGYQQRVVDILSIPIMKQVTKRPVLLDATHSIQLPAAGCGCSASLPRPFARTLALAATAAGADGIFLEVYPDPDQAKCDGPNSIRLDELEPLMKEILSVRKAISQ